MNNSDDGTSEPPDDFLLSDLCDSVGDEFLDALCQAVVDALRARGETTGRTDGSPEETPPAASRSSASRSRLRAARRKAARRRPGAGSRPRSRSDVPREAPSPRPRHTYLIVFLPLPPD